MSAPLTLFGYRYSSYTRIVRIVLRELRISYAYHEADPFSENPPKDLLDIHPFGHVPALRHGTFALYETAVITRYLCETFRGEDGKSPLLPDDTRKAARMAQVIAIIDGHGYRPMVRQVFAQRVFGPAEGRTPDETEIAAGMKASAKVLSVLDGIAAEGLCLDGRTATLADCHLAPTIDYFIKAPEGAALFDTYPALAHWWRSLPVRAALDATDPGLPNDGT
ncbi:glutathione S-transferase family protein [Rhodospirillaceae bacterium KN72]|uniref:glutathione transferase n=1 Tax=Pacificispira spongiicola TaxID=2729598 RepID=A0A7Y0HGE0_9PROT|nr:glutathione S-transferase family protein [Pacificispira spongiicola]NMM44259.1 glutathione S-transferase family protein [Pacificispira spongiicola]